MTRDPEVLAMLEALRAEMPDVIVETEHAYHAVGFAVVRARIALPDGGVATGHGSADGSGVGVVELAEDRALARVLALIGYVAGADAADFPLADPAIGFAQVSDDEPSDPFNLGETPSAADVAAATGMRLGAGQLQRSRRVAPTAAVAGSADDEPYRADNDDDEPEPRQEGSRRGDADADDGSPSTDTSAGDEDDADVTHRGFWHWAEQRYGLKSKEDVEQLLGRSISGMMPGQVRELIMAAHDADEDAATST